MTRLVELNEALRHDMIEILETEINELDQESLERLFIERHGLGRFEELKTIIRGEL